MVGKGRIPAPEPNPRRVLGEGSVGGEVVGGAKLDSVRRRGFFQEERGSVLVSQGYSRLVVILARV